MATVRTYLPILVARHAKEQLTSAAQAEGRIAKTVPELLFVCVHNAGRSQMAAAPGRAPVGAPGPRPLRRLSARRGGQPARHPGPRRTRHHPGRALPEAVVRQRRPRRRRHHHHGLRRRLPHLPRQALRGLGRAPTPPTSRSRPSATSATTSRPASQPCCATSSTDQPRPNDPRSALWHKETRHHDHRPEAADCPPLGAVRLRPQRRPLADGRRLHPRTSPAAPSRSAPPDPNRPTRSTPQRVEAMLEEGIDISAEMPKILTTDAVQASDVVITMGCGDTCPIFPGKRYEDWVLEDPAGQGRRRGPADPRRDQAARPAAPRLPRRAARRG